jgi:hypothetical protein
MGGCPGSLQEEIKVARPETRCKTKLNMGLTRQLRVRREAHTISGVPDIVVGTSPMIRVVILIANIDVILGK